MTKSTSILVLVLLTALLAEPAFTQEFGNDAAEALRAAYDLDKSGELLWYFERKLTDGSAAEKYGVLTLFKEERIYSLIPYAIEAIGDTQGIQLERFHYSDMSVSRYSTSALVAVAKSIGMWDESYEHLYVGGDIEEMQTAWRAFWGSARRMFPKLLQN